VNAWGYLAFSMQLVFTDLGPIFIINFAAMLLSQETGTGTIRAALAAPVHRWELYAAKAAVGLLYMLVSRWRRWCSQRRWPKSIMISARWGILSASSMAGESPARVSVGLCVELDSAGGPGGVWPVHFHDHPHAGNGGIGGHRQLVDH
jgi:hypothetical protein